MPEFNFSRYASPGYWTSFDFNVLHDGVYRGQCTQLCGLYHSIMFFNVRSVSPTAYASWLRTTHAFQVAHPSSIGQLRPACMPTRTGQCPALAIPAAGTPAIQEGSSTVTDVIAPPGVQEYEELHLPPSEPGHGHQPTNGAHDDHGPTGILKWLTSTDHKVIGLSYMITAIAIFYLSGVMALLMRLN